MKDVIFLLTKDCLSCEALPCYGNTFWSTPNIDELSANGTVYKKHYSAGASTAMSMTAMLSGHYPYEFSSRKIFTSVIPNEFPSIFEYYQQQAFECHLIWDITWMEMAWRFVREFGDENKTIVHNLDIAQPAGGHKKNTKKLVRNDALLDKTYEQIDSTLKSIDFSKPQFVWMHLPHVLKGRRSYMDDMDAFDNIVGKVRSLVGDDSIYLSSDHGHMNMHKGIVGYGFHLYEPIIHIPLITPGIDGVREVNDLTCNVDLPILLKTGKLPLRDYVISETAYKGQPHRKTAIFDGKYKYIFNKKLGIGIRKSEEFYDLQWDEQENYNMLIESYYDKYRRKYIIYDELYFYPGREEALKEVNRFRNIINEFWIKEPFPYEIYGIIRKKFAFLKKIKKS